MTIDQEILDLINDERSDAGLDPLSWNQQLDNAAESHSEDMALNDFFGHIGSDGSTSTQRINQSGYAGSPASAGIENIGVGYNTPGAVIEGWMSSDMGHREAILNPDADDIGVGYYYLENDTGSENWNHYWTVTFGTNGDPPQSIDSLTPVDVQVGMLPSGSPQTFSDSVGDADIVDNYAFSVRDFDYDSVYLANIRLTGLSNDADMRLIEDFNGNGMVDDDQGEVLGVSENWGTDPESIVMGLDEGDYVLQVYQWEGDTNYDLTFA